LMNHVNIPVPSFCTLHRRAFFGFVSFRVTVPTVVGTSEEVKSRAK
jgi:hypothetical protein